MRELRPLHLPHLVAARRSLEQNEEMHSPADTPPSGHSRQSSQSTASESSPATPPVPAPLRGHARFPNPATFLPIATNLYELTDPSGAIRKPVPLSDVLEDPMERDEVPDAPDSSFGSASFDHPYRWSGEYPISRTSNLMTPPAEYYIQGDFFHDREVEEERLIKRRRSASSFSSFARVWDRVGSLSKKAREKKSVSFVASGHGPDANPSPMSASRASSRASSSRGAGRDSSMDEPVSRAPTHIETIVEDDVKPDHSDDAEEPARVSTPLLHPLMVDIPKATPSLQSPLQSPTVATPTANVSGSNTPIGTPQVPGLPSPPLSAKPSVASFHRSRGSPMVPSSEIPPMLITDPVDEWADKLGHANFTVEPEPYMPETCDGISCQQLLADWQRARSEYAMHLGRTSTHFGPTSKIYSLTQEKWAEIDAQWKRNHDLAMLKAAQSGHSPGANTPTEPAPVAVIPNLDDPRSQGKFPKLGDADIVGPMVQAPPPPQRRASKRGRFFLAMESIQSPMRVLKRSFSARR